MTDDNKEKQIKDAIGYILEKLGNTKMLFNYNGELCRRDVFVNMLAMLSSGIHTIYKDNPETTKRNATQVEALQMQEQLKEEGINQ